MPEQVIWPDQADCGGLAWTRTFSRKIGWSLADGRPLAGVVAQPPAQPAAATMLADYINCPATQGGPMTGPEHYRRAELADRRQHEYGCHT